jgi:L-ascorbate metabolism protein UlaG (beta-lactamase superfamily)
MHISWHGLSCVKIQTATSVLVINPFQNSFGVQMPKFKTNVAISTDSRNDQTNNTSSLQGEPFFIGTAGEYEVNGMFITGVQYNGGHVMYLIEVEGITLAHLGTVSTELTDEQLEVLEGVDVLFLPLTCEKGHSCSRMVSQIEPRVIIPIQYKAGKFNVELDSIAAFAKEMGVKDATGEDKIILKVKDLPVEETQVKILNIA